MLIVGVLLATLALRIFLVGFFGYLLIPRSRRCPGCGAETVALAPKGLLRIVRTVERRWCLGCGWSWYRKRLPAVPAPREVPKTQSLK